MKRYDLTTAYHAIEAWANGKGSIDTIATYLGAKGEELFNDWLFAKLCDNSGQPLPDYTPDQVLNTVLLYLAMRKSFR